MQEAHAWDDGKDIIAFQAIELNSLDRILYIFVSGFSDYVL